MFRIQVTNKVAFADNDWFKLFNKSIYEELLKKTVDGSFIHIEGKANHYCKKILLSDEHLHKISLFYKGLL